MMRQLLTALVVLGLVATLPEALAGTVSMPDGGTAAAPELEIVDRAQCIVRKSALEQRALESTKFSANRRSGVNDPAGGKAHIRWIVSRLPDAGGTVKYMGPGRPTYAGSPFWRHPVNVRVQVVANGTVVNR